MQTLLTLTTPALLFPAISLLLLAYTNRFLTLSQLVRSLYPRFREQQDARVFGQLENLRLRLKLIRFMQFFGASSFFLCVLCMLLIFQELNAEAETVFASSLTLLLTSLALSVWEINISVKAIDLELQDLEEMKEAMKSKKP